MMKRYLRRMARPGGVDQRRQALGRGNTRASGRKRHVIVNKTLVVTPETSQYSGDPNEEEDFKIRILFKFFVEKRYKKMIHHEDKHGR